MLNPDRTTKIIAPAGCGKTTRLLEIVDELITRRVDTREIIFTTFTRAAAYEARDRACEKFGLGEDHFPFFRTLHSLCLRFLGRRNVMHFRDYLSVAKSLGLFLNLATMAPASAPTTGRSTVSKGDHFLHLVNDARLRMIPLGQAWENYSDRNLVPYAELEQFSQTLDNYKTLFGKIDFTDMLSEFLAIRPRLSVRFLIVDETQDLSPLQWEVLTYLASLCERTYLAGDDDQCIHAYAGATPDILIDLDCAVEHRLQSFRVPGEVQKVADKVVKRIARRIPKQLVPRDAPGEVYHATNLDDITLEQPGSWFFLARNTCFFELFTEHLIRQGALFTVQEGWGVENGIRADLVPAVKAWERLHTEQVPIHGWELKQIYKFLRVGRTFAKGYKQVVDAIDDAHYPITLKDCVKEFGLLRGDPWDKQFELTSTEKSYLQAAWKRTESFNGPDIHISTIHSVKGREADNVVLLPDMTRKTWLSYQKETESEHRVWYVGVTRARERLYLLTPYTNMFYSI